MKTIIYKILVLMLGAIFTVCGDGKSGLGDSGEDKVELVGSISLGISVAGAEVLAQDASGNQLASGVSDSNGSYALELDDNTTGPIVILSEVNGVTLVNTITGSFSLAKPGTQDVARKIKRRHRRNVNRLTTYVNKRVLGDNLEDLGSTDEETFNTEADSVVDASIGGGLSYNQFSEVESQARVDGDDTIQATAEALIVETIEERAEEAGDFDTIMDEPDTAVSCADSATIADPPAFLESDGFNGQLTGKFMLSGYSADETESSMAALVGDTSAVLDTLKQLTVIIENFTTLISANSATIGGVGQLKLALDGLVSAVTSVIDQATCSSGSEVAFTGNELGNLAENVTDIAGEAVISAVDNSASDDPDYQEEMLEYIGEEAADSIVTAAGGNASDLTNEIDDSTQDGYATTVQSDVDSDVSTVESAGDTIFEDLNGASSALEITFSGSDDADSVTDDLTLPTSGENGTTVSWASSDTGVVATDGTVTQPIGDDKYIILTATITKSGISISRDFILNVDGVVLPAGTEITNGWDKQIDVNTSGDKAHDIDVDSSGNVYIAGETNGNGTGNDWHILKFGSDGTAATWNTTTVSGTTNTNDYERAQTIKVIGSDVYVGGNLEDSTSYDIWTLKKFNLSGTEDTTNFPISLDWQTTDPNDDDILQSLDVDGSGNVYIGGGANRAFDAVNGWALGIAAYDNTATAITGWDNNTHYYDDVSGGNSSHGLMESIMIHSSGDIYACGRDSGSNGVFWLKKFNTGGTEDTANWNKKIYPSSGAAACYDMVEDSSGDIIFVGGIEAGAWGIKKFQADGTEITTGWDKTVALGTTTAYADSVTIDEDDNIYIVGYANNVVNGSSNNDVIMRAYDSDGTELTGLAVDIDGGSNGNDYGRGVVVSGDYVYITGSVNNGSNDDIIIKKYVRAFD